jgi:hypothetical protein
VGTQELAANGQALPQPAQLVRRGRYVYPAGLRFNLPFYLFHKFFKPGNPILLFEYLRKFGRAAHSVQRRRPLPRPR